MALEAQKKLLTGKLTDLQKDLGFAKFVAGPSREPVIQGNRVFVYTEGSGNIIKSTLDQIIEQTDALYKRPSGVSSKEGDFIELDINMMHLDGYVKTLNNGNNKYFSNKGYRFNKN